MRNWWSLVILLAAAFSFLLPGSAGAEEWKVSDMNNYQIFFNNPNDEIIEDMKNFDLVIIEPQHYTPEQIAEIQSGGTRVLGYINVMEADNWNTEVMSQMQDDDFFYRDGGRIYYPQWDSYLTDITSERVHSILLEQIERHVQNKQIDGIFLDTVGNIDNEHSGSDLSEQRAGLEQFLQKVRAQVGEDMQLVQNWGFDTLAETSVPYVDGITWENFEVSTISQDSWAQSQIERLQQLQQDEGIAVLTVSFEEEASYEYAAELGFIHEHDPDYYNVWTYADTKYLPQGSPEAEENDASEETAPEEDSSTSEDANEETDSGSEASGEEQPSSSEEQAEETAVDRTGQQQLFDGEASYRMYFYGPNETMMEEAGNYDALFIEPTLFTKEQIEQIQAQGTLVFGQITATQVSSWQSGLADAIDADDVVKKLDSETSLMDLTSSSYQTVLQNHIDTQVHDKGLDGVFFSTAADLEWTYDQQDQQAQQKAFASIAKSMKEQNLFVVQSDAFETLKTHTSSIVDGVIWTPFNYSSVNSGWAASLAEDLQELQQKQNLDVLTFSSEEEQATHDYARSLGFQHAHDTGGFVRW
ncbi:endo alpha-1,4 polygalactosaminidase [Alkalicoccus urumqiensis]|uniref:Glycoside-hydrolase family GH114 TIM-barrel domain-containing protein n=1 Tax=Alkalicoccus urumqiensis TaxID=1548213 RepID=A0A2P6ML91_ALKUR|nr:endo alpha-1,4 polygalactosaminidase [Alkalicoccus urumqiensis]PRO67057.1 hypothetical protein C6I21_00375 [Alkalicoccus urumqiensis]